MRDPYVEFARMAYNLQDWHTVFCMTNEALKIKNKSKIYVNSEHSWNHTVDDLCSISCYWLGMYERSLLYAKKALEYLPNNKRLKENYELIKKKVSKSY